jgi:ribosomal protein L11 methyltransferase
MKGASEIIGIDNDSWAVENARENLELNHITNAEILAGDASLLEKTGTFELVLANINRNILLEDMPAYHKVLKNKGQIILSGFYSEDITKIDQTAKSLGWKHILTKEQNNWIAVAYRKP